MSNYQFKLISFLIFILPLTPCSLVSAAPQEDLTETVKQQATEIDKIKSELQSITTQMNEDDSPGPLDQIEIHGFISQGYVKSRRHDFIDNSSNGSFELNEVGINFTTQLSPKLHVGMQIMSRDYGNVDNNKIVLDWAVASYRWQDWMGIRVGRIKAPLGLYSDTRDMDAFRTFILLPTNMLYDETWRELMGFTNGISFFGYIPTDSLGSLKYDVQYGYTHFDDEDGSMAQRASFPGLASQLGDFQGTTSDYTCTARMDWFTPLEGFRLGTSVSQYQYQHDYAVTSGSTQAIAQGYGVGDTFSFQFNNQKAKTLAAEYTKENLVLAAEWMTLEGSSNVLSIHQHNWYVSACYRLNDLFEFGTYYSKTKWAHGGEELGKFTDDTAIALRFDINDNWIVKAEGHYFYGLAEVPSHYTMWLLKTTISF